MERAKPQAATKLVSQAGKNVSRKTRKPAQLRAFSFQIIISIMDNILGYYLTPILPAVLQTCINTQVDKTCLVQQLFNLLFN